jgi:uncharacterized protein
MRPRPSTPATAAPAATTATSAVATTSPHEAAVAAEASGPAPATSTPDAQPPAPREPAEAEQHRLATSVLLHLWPGAALLAFVLATAPFFARFGIPAPFVLFLGIPAVIVPIELGTLLVHARRRTGSWRLSPLTVGYRERLPRRRARWLVAGLVAWFLLFFLVSTAVVDPFLAERAFGWLPDAVLQFSTFEDGGVEPSTLVTVLLLVTAVVCNGVVGPVVEELYFRGYLLPRISRFGRAAPVLNTALFSLYHLWTPWQNPARIIGLVPMTWMVWRERSLRIGIATHVIVNLLFLALLFAMIATGSNG